MVDCQFIAAMGPPGGGRNFITPRYARHYNHVAICDVDDRSMQRIFTRIMDWALTKVQATLSSQLDEFLGLIGSADATALVPSCNATSLAPRLVRLLFVSRLVRLLCEQQAANDQTALRFVRQRSAWLWQPPTLGFQDPAPANRELV